VLTVTTLTTSATLTSAATVAGPGAGVAPEHDGDGAGGLRSVSIAVSALDCFAVHRELGATQVARELGVAKSTACRTLAALAAGGLLERAGGGRYRLSLRMFELGLLAAERMPVREVARPVLMGLHEQLREMVQLGVPVAGHVVYIDRYGNSGLGIQLSGEVVRRVPGYSSSSGRVLAAFDEGIMADTLAVPRRRHTPFTITDTERLHRVLKAARSAGWTGTREELAPGYSSVAAPILVPVTGGMRPVAAISVVGPTAHILGLRKDFIVASACRAARRVGLLLAHSGPPSSED
jgi:IclR family transcriptional regulator, KDG regulon repressor